MCGPRPFVSQARPTKGLGGEGGKGKSKKKRSHEDAAEAEKAILKICDRPTHFGEGQVPKNHHFLVFVTTVLNGKNPQRNQFLVIKLKLIPVWVLGIMVFDAFCKKTELDPGLWSTRVEKGSDTSKQYQKTQAVNTRGLVIILIS